MVRGPDLKSAGRRFKYPSDHLADVVLGRSWIKVMLVNSQLVCLPPAGTFEPFFVSGLRYFFPSVEVPRL